MSDEGARALGLDPGGITAWMAARTTVDPPLRFARITGGLSNLTFDMRDGAGRHWVLRRPPLHGVQQSAHDMQREHRIMAALSPSAVPVPPMVGLCEDEAVTGAPFFVMDYVDGLVMGDAEVVAGATDERLRTRASAALVDTLAALHRVDPDAVGLGDLGRRERYCARQLKRWSGQWQKVRTRDIPEIMQAHDRLAADIPPQDRTAIVHGDYRIDNVIVDRDGDVAAVVDWELCTLGDPLADLGMLWVYWQDPDDDLAALPQTVTKLPGFARKTDLVDRYARVSGSDLAEFEFYIALAYWRLAIILEGVYSRFSAGAYGDIPARVRGFEHSVPELAVAALEATERSGR
ncbi:MAG TPA: phosphotransferase family protein [Euzebyales bacterium]|nr:phosphotransferase family protein [Euzebyales bacterium]